MVTHHEKKSDSIVHHEERAKKIRAEAAEREKEKAATEAKHKTSHQQDRAMQEARAFIHDSETREQLLERIRQTNEEVNRTVFAPPPRSEAQEKLLNAEQEAGRAAVAAAEAEADRMRELRKRLAAEQAEREGTMTPVVHPNPGQDEKFPVVKATIK